jgi:hypothetical protein
MRGYPGHQHSRLGSFSHRDMEPKHEHVFILPSTLFCEVDPCWSAGATGSSSGVAVGTGGLVVDLVMLGGAAKAAAGGTWQCA